VSRFILDGLSDYTEEKPAVSPADTAILSRLHEVVAEITTCMNKFQFHLASEKIYHYIWSELADVILEESKPILQGTDADARRARQYVLRECLVTSLKLLHPFMPFVTEAIWQNLPQNVKKDERDMLIVAEWPKY
jgi:valyl-tRNA synthetase